MGSLLIGLSTKDCIFKAPVSVVSGLSRSRGRAQRPEFFVPLVIYVNELRSRRIEHFTHTVCDSTRKGSWSERFPTSRFIALSVRNTVYLPVLQESARYKLDFRYACIYLSVVEVRPSLYLIQFF